MVCKTAHIQAWLTVLTIKVPSWLDLTFVITTAQHHVAISKRCIILNYSSCSPKDRLHLLGQYASSIKIKQMQSEQ